MVSRILYSMPFFIAAGSMAVVALFALRRYQVRGAIHLILLCLSACIWAATEGMLYFGLDPDTNMRITRIQYFGIAPVPPLALLFSLSLFGFESWITRARASILLFIAAGIIVLVLTNPFHKLMFSRYYPIDTGPFTMLGLEHGPAWKIVLGYHYLLVAVLSIILIRLVGTSTGLHRYQAGLVLSAVAVVWVVNVVYATGHSPIPNMDMSPLAFTLVGWALAWWGFHRFNLLDIMPVAKTEIFRNLDDAVLVIDAKDRVIEINPAAELLFNAKSADTIGKHASEKLANYAGLRSALNAQKDSEIVYATEDGERIFDLGVSPLRGKKGVDLGRMIVLRDITRRKRMETELRESKQRLETILKALPVAVLSVDADTQEIIDANSRAARLIGIPVNSMIGVSCRKFLRKANGNPLPMENIQDNITSGDGSFIPILRSVLPLTIDGKKILLESFIDMRDHKRAERVQMEKEKLQGVVEMAGAVCHELNQPLQVITGYSELLTMGGSSETEINESLDCILKEISRMGAITRKLMRITKYKTKNYLEGRIIDIDESAG